jgi:manganese/iron transport system ATP-binding protein
MSYSGAIAVNNLGVCYRTVEALRDISLHLCPGKVTGVFGPNGAGKSTLVKAMLGLIPTNTGTVFYDGLPLQKHLDRVAYVPQRSQIDWTYPVTVWDVVMMSRVRKTGWFRRFSSISRRQAMAALAQVEMLEYKNRPLGQLSGGQQQRVFLARSIAQEAEIFFFDEPFVGVDRKTEQIIFNLFHELADMGKIVVVVNHDLGESITNFDDLILLNKELIAAGQRQQVLQEENVSRAYGSKVDFFVDDKP